MKKYFSRRWLAYKIDCLMSKGPTSMAMLLFLAMLVVVLALGLLAFILGGGKFVYQLWLSLLHTMDPGTLAANSTANIPYLLIMLLATLFGMLFTSILIGIVSSGIESKLRELRRGSSVVLEEGHTLIIGFNESVFDLLHELITANENLPGSPCVVILGTEDKSIMEETIAARIPDTGNTRVICRSGSVYESASFELCSLENSNSVIINIHDDTECIRVILSFSAYLKKNKLLYSSLRAVATINDWQYVEAARIAGEGRVDVIFSRDAIARIIAHTCRQHGLSQVLTELLNFGGCELYFEKIPRFSGKSFKDSLLSFENARPIGLFSEGRCLLNPPMERIIGDEDQLILLEEDNGAFRLCQHKKPDEDCIVTKAPMPAINTENLLILGSNSKLPMILHEFGCYVSPGSRVTILDEDLDASLLPAFEGLELSICNKAFSRELLQSLLDNGADNVLLLNDSSTDRETADSITLLKLILLRDIADNSQHHYSITTEMWSAQNQRLASQARVDDFVIGTNFASLLMAQVSQNPKMLPMLEELLDADGSELYMKKAEDYIPIGRPVPISALIESAARRGELFIGYRIMTPKPCAVVLNPNIKDSVIFNEKDLIVVISQK